MISTKLGKYGLREPPFRLMVIRFYIWNFVDIIMQNGATKTPRHEDSRRGSIGFIDVILVFLSAFEPLWQENMD
ncbi:MAG: hypothetical protein CVT99_02370 [Bacteroidetes bacterium HGW-Bacteroidetes-16]|nr:MAG: hypothetical protein CVT99_02370 [Bacteroidetes bacterium HGW-Bacteroidetes-16]